MIEIEAPDGTIVEFPDDTSEATILSVMRENYPAGRDYSAGASQAGKSFGRKLSEFVLGDNDPTTQNTGEKIGSWLNKAGEAMTFGLVGDEASAAVESALLGADYGQRRDHYRQQQRQLEGSNPKAALAADVAGGLLGAIVPAGQVGTLARGAGILPRVGASVLAGAGMGATQGYMEGESPNGRLSGAATGATYGAGAGLVAPAFGSLAQRVADRFAATTAMRLAARGAPSTDELRRMGNEAYQAVDDAGAQITPEAFDGARQKIIAALRANTGFDELPGPGSLTPNASRAVQIMGEASNRMAQEPTAALPFSALDQMRRQAGAAAGNIANPADRSAGMEIIRGLDDFVGGLRPGDMAAGDAEALKSALPKAREIWGRMKRSQLVDDAIEAGSQGYMSGASSGIRSQFAAILRNKKLASSFSGVERAAMQRVVNGTVPAQIITRLGSGAGQLMQMGLGTVAGGPMGGMIGAGTAAATRKAAEAISRRSAETARAIVANGGTGALPEGTEASRRIIEALIRRYGAAAPAL